MARDFTLLTNEGDGGYTMTELLVVVGIIVLMTSLILPNWRSGDRSLALARTAAKVGQDVRRAQELAMRAQAYTCATGSITGYGIYFNVNTPESYILFAECNDTNTYDAGLDGVVETITMESGVQMQSVTPTPAVSIVFIPPTPIVWIKPGDPSQAQIVLERKDGVAGTRIVTVSSKGIIDVD
ncbi:prepilin-type N-terminal cleavage/methylation domain-containing protein [Patescibacteria group bacterium]|nr:prepilin-type N-terminal cleavage/methylation domain-containing protein [Patescibacteria group bacterium]